MQHSALHLLDLLGHLDGLHQVVWDGLQEEGQGVHAGLHQVGNSNITLFFKNNLTKNSK